MRALLLAGAAGALSLATSAPSAAQEARDSAYIRVVDQADRGEMVFLIGPVDLPAGHGAHMHMSDLPLQTVAFPRAGWITGFATDMVDAKGAPLRERFLHHLNVIDPDHRELFSPVARRVMAAGSETGEKELPPSMGLPVEAGRRLLVKAVFHNPTSTARRQLYLRLRFQFTPSQAGAGRAGVYPVYMDVRPPVGKKAFDLVPGVSAHSREGSPAVSGRLLAAGGHMHKYGKSLILEDVTAGKVLWKVEPRVAADGEIESISVGSFWKKGGIPLRADHVYRLTVNYDNSTGELIPDGGMGALGGVFIPEPGEDWPEVAKEDSQYLADLRYQRAGGTGMGDEMQAAAGATDASAEAAPGERAGDSDDRAGDEHAGTASTGAPAMRSAGAEHHP